MNHLLLKIKINDAMMESLVIIEADKSQRKVVILMREKL